LILALICRKKRLSRLSRRTERRLPFHSAQNHLKDEYGAKVRKCLCWEKERGSGKEEEQRVVFLIEKGQGACLD
jgi:hypothetical protein